MAGGRAATRLERAPLLGGDVSAVTLRDAEEGRRMRGGADVPFVSDRRTSFGNTFASSSREGALVDEARRDAEARSRRGDASAKARWRLVGLGAVASTALLALAMRADLATPPNAIELGDARVTDGGAWGFGADGTHPAASAIGHEPTTRRDVQQRVVPRHDATEGTTWRGNVASHHPETGGETGGGGVVARHDTRDAPDWVRSVAPFDEERVTSHSLNSETPLASDARLPFDPVIDWADEEAEREWPLFGSLEGAAEAAEAADRRSARAEAGDARPTVFDTPDSRRAARVRRRAERRAEAEAAAAAREADRSRRLARAEPFGRTGEASPVSSSAQPRRGMDWVNPAGVRATFAVNTCGVPPAVRARQAPWPACRVLLVGCPGGRSAPDADPAKPACAEWDVSRALEMVPASDSENFGLGSFSVTTSMYGPGDEFAFAMVKPGCTDAQIARALRAQGGAGPSDGSEASAGLENGGCEVRLDSGFPMGNQLLNPGTRTTRCWTPNDAVTDVHRVAGDALCESVGASSEASARKKDAAVSSLEKVSREAGPVSPFEARGDTCLLRRDAAYARGKFHRVVPSFEADVKEELGSAVTPSSPPRVSFVWGTCDAQPRSEAWCAPPTFDARRVAAVCGVEYREPKSAESSPSSSSSSLGADAKEPKGETETIARRDDADANAKAKKKTDATAGTDDEPEGRPSANRATSPDASNAKRLASSDASSDESRLDGSARKTRKTTKPMTREEEKARVAARAAALRSKSEPLLSDDAATRAETALAEKEAEGREATRSTRSTPAVTHASASTASSGKTDLSKTDLFASDPDAPAAPTAPGAWAETPPTRVFFEDDAPHAMAHLLLRDGDARFATEHLPWAELVVNGAPTRAPTQLARGDVVQLRVRAETEAETEERVESNVLPNGNAGVSRTEPRTRVATLVIGGRSGSLRARVDDTAETSLGARARRKSEESSSEKYAASSEKYAAEKSKSPSETASEPGTLKEGDAIKRDQSARDQTHMTLDGAAPGTTAHVLEVTAPRAGQWMVLPPVDAPAVIVSGVGEGARAAVTVRFADASERPEDAAVVDSVSLDSASLDSAAILGADSRGSDRRVAPGGDANGVFAKIDGKDEAVDARRDRSVSVWTREETMQIARGGALGNGARAESEPRSVTVKDGDKLRVKVRAGPKQGEATRLAVFVGDKRVGTAVVATAATAEEADAAGAALDGRLREAKKEAQKEAAVETRAVTSRLASVGKAADVRLTSDTSENASSSEDASSAASSTTSDATTEDAAAGDPPSSATLVSLITGREITAEEMRAAPSGSTRVVLAGSRVSLPSAGFMTVAGVLPSAELKLLVHAYEQSAGKEIERRAVADDAGAGAEEEKSASLGDDDAWRTARLGTSDDTTFTEAFASSLGASAGAGRLPDWLEVRVEGAVVTPPVPVWLARRISVKLTAAPEAGVARRVVLRAGDQTWQATVVSAGPAAETRDGAIARDSTPREVVAAVSGLRDDVQTAVERDAFVDGDQDERLDSLEKKNAAEDRDESEQDARVEKLETEVEELLVEVDQAEDEAVQEEDEEDSSSSVEEEDESSDSSSSPKLALVPPVAPSRPSETPWLEGSPVDALTHAMLSDEVTATIARAAETDAGASGANGSSVATRRVAARFRAVSTPRNHTVFAAAGAAAIAPTPLPRDAALLAASIRLTSAGGVADGVLDVSNATRADGDNKNASAGEPIRGLGPDGSCRVVAKAVDEAGSVVSVPSPNGLGLFTPAWARLIVNGALVPRSNETDPNRPAPLDVGREFLTLRDGDVVSVAVVAGARAGDARTLLVLCVATDPAFPFDDVMNDPAYADDAAANGETVETVETAEEIAGYEYAAPGDAVLVLAATAIAEPTPPFPPPPAPPPPFPPAAATLAAAARGTGVPACDAAGVRRREGAKRLIFDRERALPREYDGTDAKPNLCGATRPVCANRADPTANLGFPLQTPHGDRPDANDRDVVFLVDVSDAVTRDAFDAKLTELLLTLFCASHEGTESQAGVVLYPAPKSAETCGAYQVAIPLARYTTREWFDAVEALRSDTSACCGSGTGTNSERTGAAPLAEALDGAGLEFEARGAHDPKKRLALVVSAGTPTPAVQDESCSESSSVAFSSMTRTFPFNEAHSDGGVVNACTYAWKYVPAAARRLERTGARVAAVNVAGDSGSDASQRALTAFGTPNPGAFEKTEKDDASFRESWRGAAGAAHFLGAPWPGACGADGHCALSAQYGGTLGRWVYAKSDDGENDEDASATSAGAAAAALGTPRRVDFRYDPGEPRTCSFDLPSDRAGRRAVAVVTEPHAAHLATIHAWNDAGAVARAAARLMCEPSTPHACATEEDDGVGVAFAQCRGAAVPSESTRDDTTACLRGLVMAACGRVDFPSDDESRDASPKCRADGRLLRDAEATDAGLVYGTLACNEVCGDETEEETSRRGGRVEVDVTCAPGEACAAGEVRRFAAGAAADARRKQSAASDSEVGLFPNLDVETIVAEATPPPPALDSSQGYGIHGK